jgi:tripartite-type tricarboxylate transporter receptor subunit TctC
VLEGFYPQHLIIEQVAKARKIKLTVVPYSSGSEATVAILGGHVPAGSLGGDWIPYVKPDGQPDKLRCLMVLTGKRMNKFPGIPAIREFGFDFEFANMLGIVGPKGIPEEIVKKLHDGFKKAMEDPLFLNVLESRNMPFTYYSSEEYGKFIKEKDKELGGLIRELGLRKE